MHKQIKMWHWGISPSILRVIPLFLYCSSLMFPVMGAPETITIPILKKIMDGSGNSAVRTEKLKEFVQTHPAMQNPQEFQNIMKKLGPVHGQLDPVMQDMLEALERTHRDTTGVLPESTERFRYPDETASNRVASSTEENGVIWNDVMSRPQGRNRDFNRFSSRYRSNQTGHVFSEYDTEPREYGHNATQNKTEHHDPHVPFNHVSDPNLRNHRLYAWEFETYKNFTHIDQAEDLMADEDIATETKINPVAVAPPPSTPPNNQLQQNSHPTTIVLSQPVNKTDKSKVDPNTHLWKPKPASKSKRVKVKGIPHIVISLEDTSETNNFPGYNFQMDSGEHSGQRPREPLRQSSTENVVYVHGSGEEGGRYPFNDLDDGDSDHYSRRFPGLRPHGFRPNPNEPSDALFIDPEPDFFTSTIRSDQEISSETMPKRRRKKLKKVQKDEIEDPNQASSNRFSNRMGERFMDGEDSRPSVHYSPVYSKNSLQGTTATADRARSHYSSGSNIYQTPGPHFPFMRPTPKYYGMDSRYKQDRILNGGEGTSGTAGTGTSNGGDEAASPSNFESFDAGTLNHLSDGGHIGNYYSIHGPPNGGSADIGLHSNLGLTGADHSQGSKNHPFSQHDISSQEHHSNGHRSRLQNVIGALMPFANPVQATKKLQANPADQIIAPGNLEDFYHPYAEADHQVNQFPDESTIAVSWSNTWYIVGAIIAFTAMMVLLLPSLIAPGRMGKKDTRHDLDEDDFNTSAYQGSNMNNMYHYDNTNNDVQQNSDLWTEVKGVYNDLVNMFRGEYSLLNKLNKKPDGPKIVYRDEDGDEEDSDEEEDDEKERLTLRNRKRAQYLKKQQQMLKKQQEQQNKMNKPLPNQNQAKSNISKKTLVSKAKVTAGARDNKDKSSGKTIEATSVNNLVVVSGPGPSIPEARTESKPAENRQEHSSPRAVTGFVIPENTTMATMPYLNTTGFGALYGTGPDGLSPFLREWAQVQLINNHNH